MIGNGLVRFHGDTTQSGGGLWKEIKKSGPAVLRDVVSETAMEGIKGLGRGAKVNWKGGLAGIKRGANRAVKRKVKQVINRQVSKKVRKDLFGV